MIKYITPEELKVKLNNGESPAIVDVREVEEVAEGMIPGAIHIPLGELVLRHNEIPQKDEIILVCRSGNRSLKASQFLEAQGFTGLFNMSGGMLAW
jgi:rhodanese-related sulfurtransferase